MELKVSRDDLEGAFAFEKVHEKYSVSAKENRCYRHRFYQFEIPFKLMERNFIGCPLQKWNRIKESWK